MPYADRFEAGGRLAARLRSLGTVPVGAEAVVLGLPRGGVPVAAAVARDLGAPLDVVLVRKLGVPTQPELAMGAIGEGGVRILDPGVLASAGVTGDELARVELRERDELERRARRYRGDRQPLPVAARTVVVVDDGIATGSTARAACQAVRARGAARVVLAVPVAPRSWTDRLGAAADDLVAVETPEPFFAIGQFYDDFAQVSDDQVVASLRRADWPGEAPVARPGGADGPGGSDRPPGAPPSP